MRYLLNQALIYTVTSNTAIRKSNATPIRAKTDTNVDRRHDKKNIPLQFLSKPIFEMFLFPPLDAKKGTSPQIVFVNGINNCRILTFNDPRPA